MTALAVYLGVAALLGVVVPFVGMRLLVPTLRESHTVTNYRGRQVFLGLGVVWLLWAGAAIVGGVLPALVADVGATVILVLAGLLTLVAFALGLVDDAYGSSAARGFKGHLTAMARGRLTTGGMKLLGISLASYVVALVLAIGRSDSSQLTLAPFLWALPAGAGIALTSNFINLTDLRPGRALKAYSLLAAIGVVFSAIGLSWMLPGEYGSSAMRVVYAAVVLVFYAFGPVLAVWRYDLGEQGMMGDAGANPMGAVAGLLIVAGLPAWGTVVYFVLMLALNLASERVSFSRIIESSALLSRVDAFGRGADR